MKQIDLDDLPPRIAQVLAALEGEEELTLVQGGVVVARLRLAQKTAAPPDDPPSEESMKEVMDHFNAMIHDEF
jgi:antitoxin (DNA-binding transcriptional repressor) of toxin-antitoxin stability system